MKNKTIKLDKLWGAAFSSQPTEAVLEYTAGRDVKAIPAADMALAQYDVWVNKAHCMMLVKKGIIPVVDGKKLLYGLSEIQTLMEKGKFILDPKKEDIHTNIEAWLTKKYGPEVAGKLHTARSRNDQITTDMRLWLRDQSSLFLSECISLTADLAKLTRKYQSTPFPGFTHHQHAMVTTFGHVLAGFASMMTRDSQRFAQWLSLHNKNPLGNVVAYGTTFPIDRKITSKYLGFDAPDINSMDAITNRWEPETDLAHAISIFMNHASHIAQTLIILATPEFGMIKLADEFSTGSSIMPQKKNPDPLEVIKAKTSFAQGQHSSLLALGKGNFIGYNRDSQWTKYIITDLVTECLPTASVLSGVLCTMTVGIEAMQAWCHKGFIGATNLMDQLIINYQIPMRMAKMIVEKAIAQSPGLDKVTHKILVKSIKAENLDITITQGEVDAWQDPEVIISLSKSSGGPGNESMKKSISKLKDEIKKYKKCLSAKKMQKAKALKELEKDISKLVGG